MRAERAGGHAVGGIGRGDDESDAVGGAAGPDLEGNGRRHDQTDGAEPGNGGERENAQLAPENGDHGFP